MENLLYTIAMLVALGAPFVISYFWGGRSTQFRKDVRDNSHKG